jgi:hypothetical protein
MSNRDTDATRNGVEKSALQARLAELFALWPTANGTKS